MTHTKPTGRKATLSALKSFAEDALWNMPEGYFAEMLGNETDRGLVIILVSIMDDVLAGVLRRKMRRLSSTMDSKIFGYESPLGSFSSRIRLAYALNVIDESTRDDLDIMRAMRNACAHARRDISFEHEELRNALALLFQGEAVQKDVRNSHHLLSKAHFSVAVRYVMSRVSGDSLEVAEKKASDLWKVMHDVIIREIEKAKAEPSNQDG